MYFTTPESSRKEDVVVGSTSIAEYVAYDTTQTLPIKLYTNSDNAVSIIKCDTYTKVAKWLNKRYHFVRKADHIISPNFKRGERRRCDNEAALKGTIRTNKRKIDGERSKLNYGHVY
ncbi:hypothetical protein N7517_010681 [Penicillium concentricum]|uniref:Uncharacterized protein n=1 Tax=Penicillium concentricum TaxID=293559 RepID=A0A9W9R998_9EURO|nr:uncharacterized protein N7517_010681 [Penicillium concentricum]KAJ5356072.1 hypothetical protein N7517_010681 [Penicillium concentricum]